MSGSKRASPKRQTFTWLAWLLLAVLFLLTQFAREINQSLAEVWYRALFFRPLGAPLEWLERHTGFQAYHARFLAKFTYTVLIAAGMVATLWFFTRDKGEKKVAFYLLAAGAAGTVVLNVMGKVLGVAWLQTFSRDTLEVLTSPFPVLFLLPVLILYRNTRQGPLKGGRQV